MSSRGKLIVFAAPSGAGKTSIVRHLLPLTELNLDFSVSATTREPRPGEKHGDHYFFLSVEEFKDKIDKGDFIEWEEVYKGMYYGTLASEVDSQLEQGTNVIFDIDVIGALNIKKIYGDQAITIFVNPPSLQALEDRLRFRKTETAASLKKRIDKASVEIEKANFFDEIIVNDILQVAQLEAESLVQGFIKKVF